MPSKRQFLKLGAALAVATIVEPATRAQHLATFNYRCGGRPFAAAAEASVLAPQSPLNGAQIPKYVEPVPVFGSKDGTVPAQLWHPRVRITNPQVTISEIQQKVLPDSVYNALPAPYRDGTYVFAFGVGGAPSLWPGVTLEAQRGSPTTISYVNNLPTLPILQQDITVDQSIHWANPLSLPMMDPGRMEPYTGPPPVTIHVHGAQVASLYDGHPASWYTPDGLHGDAYSSVFPTSPNGAVYQYPNTQEATTLWFHDHTLGETRANVYRGLACFYLIRDRFDTGNVDNPLHLPAGPYERELVIQDRQFDTNGQLYFPDGSPNGQGSPLDLNGTPPNPLIHPFWIPEFFGDVMTVNGKSWPYFAVEPRRYRLRLIDGSNARFLRLELQDDRSRQPGPVFYQIGTDGGLLDTPVGLEELFLAPGERADVIVDFAGLAGHTFTLRNTANAPYPSGGAPDPETNGQIMQFRVSLPLQGPDTTLNPARGAPLRGGPGQPPAIVRLVDPTSGAPAAGVTIDVRRQLVLVEVEGTGGPIMVLLNNTHWDGIRDGSTEVVSGGVPDGLGDFLTEEPTVGATELWEIINLTGDAHPIHLHLIQFQLMNRQAVDVDGYRALYDSFFPGGQYDGQLPDGSWGPMTYAPATYIPGYGAPTAYQTPNADGAIGGNPAVSPYLQGPAMPPYPNEAGWKDTIKVLPDEVTRIIARWAPTDASLSAARPGVNLFPFDPSAGPGYVWHCHILDHEDNEMMRPYKPSLTPPPT
jgi:FtsP/CotA-like multicopper oxidase with cupredoxin domain